MCQQELLLPFNCKRRGFCPSCAGRRMAQTAAVTLCIRQWGEGPDMLEPHERGKAGMSPHLPEGGVLRTQSLGKFLPDHTPGIRVEMVEPGIGNQTEPDNGSA